MSVPLITNSTVIDRGLMLSPNFLIDHVSVGAFHTVLGQWIPKYTSILNPQQAMGMFGSNLPLSEIFANFQQGSNGILENLLSEAGSLLSLRSGFMNNIPNTIGSINEMNHLTGMSFDIGLKGYEDNVYNVAKDIRSMARQASSIDVIYGNTSYFHINYDPKAISRNMRRVELPTIRSIDLLDGEIVNDLVAMRGFN